VAFFAIGGVSCNNIFSRDQNEEFSHRSKIRKDVTIRNYTVSNFVTGTMKSGGVLFIEFVTQLRHIACDLDTRQVKRSWLSLSLETAGFRLESAHRVEFTSQIRN